MAIRRAPQGTPQGGQFAAGFRDEADGVDIGVDAGGLSGSDLYGQPRVRRTSHPLDSVIASEISEAGGREALLGEEAAWSWTAMTEEYGPRFMRRMYDENDGSLGSAIANSQREWHAQGFSSRGQFGRARTMDVDPADIWSGDPDLMLCAKQARGDLVIDGRLSSNGYELANHSRNPALKGRVVAHPKTVTSAGEQIRWDDLTGDEQAAYIDGYASAAESIAELRERHGDDWHHQTIADRGIRYPNGTDINAEVRTGVRAEGFTRAFRVERARDEIMAGDWNVEVYDPSTFGRTTRVSHAFVDLDDRSSAPFVAVGKIDSGQRRVTPNGETVPVANGGQPIRFALDQII